MTSGGARGRSGPSPQERSGRSERRGYKLSELPPEGFDGEPPAFPLPGATDRELEVWADLWRTPQACAWSLPSERWRQRIVGLYVRQSVKCEAADVGAGQIAQVHRFADQIGLTDAGLAAMGWKIAKTDAESRPSGNSPRTRRLRGVPEPEMAPTSAMERARRRAEERAS